MFMRSVLKCVIPLARRGLRLPAASGWHGHQNGATRRGLPRRLTAHLQGRRANESDRSYKSYKSYKTYELRALGGDFVGNARGSV